MDSIVSKLKSFKWQLWLSLCALALAPAIYQTVRTYLVSINSSTVGIDIIGQMEWYDLIDETIRAFLIVPLYSILNKIFIDNKNNLSNMIFKLMIIVFVLYALFNVGIFIYGNSLISFMNPQENDLTAISNYLKLETIAFMIGIVVEYFKVVFVVTENKKNVYLFLFVQMIMVILNDTIFIYLFGVNGVAISNLLTNLVLTIAGFVVLHKQGFISYCKFSKNDFKYFKDWINTGLFSGLQQFIDNIIYALMIARMVNMVSEQGNYWVANNFIWGFLLVPVTALGEIIKTDCKESTKVERSNYYYLSVIIFISWLVSTVFWFPFMSNIQKLENASEIITILYKLVPFYIAYTLCIIPDSIFIGHGKTIYNAINSILVNFIYYGIWFILFRKEVIIFDMNKIIMMFGFGMVFHLLISWIEQYIFDHKYSKS